MEKHRRYRPDSKGVLSALTAAASVLLATTVAASALRNSELYSKSRLISMIVSQEQINLTDMAGNKRNVDMMLKFVGALTSAYIDFEMIPVGEVGTFTAVFESIPSGVAVDRFAYHRKDLYIEGTAENREEYDAFLTALRGTGHFEEVQEGDVEPEGEAVRFLLICVSRAYTVSLEL